MNKYIYAWILTEYLKGNIDVSKYIATSSRGYNESYAISLDYGCKVYKNNLFSVFKDNKWYSLMIYAWQYDIFIIELNVQPYMIRNNITIKLSSDNLAYFLENGYLSIDKTIN